MQHHQLRDDSYEIVNLQSATIELWTHAGGY